jgi:hypothetical protein
VASIENLFAPYEGGDRKGDDENQRDSDADDDSLAAAQARKFT